MRLFVDNLTNVDFSYLCPSRGLVGETWLAHIELIGELDQQGMICDFGIVKKALRNWLDEHLDHRLVVPALYSGVRHSTEEGKLSVELITESGTTLYTRSPEQAISLVDSDRITGESVAQWCLKALAGIFGDGVRQIRLSFTPEAIEGPYYHYSHGLKKHQGNCQRIAHGHRSKILVWRNDELCQETMNYWAEKWRDIYIASNEDRVSATADSVNFSYVSQQGEFHLTLPASQCYFIDTDTTVEHLAQHLADQISQQHPGEHIKVKAFEGVGKGAIAQS